MKLQRTPLVLLLVALGLGAGVYIYETQVRSQQEETQAKAEKLFPFEEKDVESLSVATLTQSLSFKKTPAPAIAKPKPQPSPSGASPQPAADANVWRMVAPQQTYADPAAVAYLLNLLATGERQQPISVPASQRSEFGFDQPFATIEVKLANQQTHKLVLGKQNFNQSAVYAQVDPSTDPNKELAIVLVSKDFENALTRPLAEWQLKQTPVK